MAKVGLLGPKRWFNSTPIDFFCFGPEGTEVAGALIPATGIGKTMAGFSLEAIKAGAPRMNDAARQFAETGANIMTQFGVPFSLIHGPDTHAIQAGAATAAGVPGVLVGLRCSKVSQDWDALGGGCGRFLHGS